MSTYSERFRQLIDNSAVTPYYLSKATGISQATISRLKSDETAKPNVSTNEKFAKYFNVNADWLMTGRNDLQIETEVSDSAPQPQISYSSGRPYYNVDFIGGFDLVFNNQTTKPEYNIDCKPYNRDGVVWCNITGHSMEPKISHGDIIALREVVDWQSYLTMGEIYAIVTNNDLRTVKVIRKGLDKDVFRLVPINTAEFDEQEIAKSMIMRVFEVLGCIKRF